MNIATDILYLLHYIVHSNFVGFSYISFQFIPCSVLSLHSLKDVNCGPLQPILKGQLNYINESTHLDSQVIYTCSRNYRMTGEPTRVCQRNGEWSGEPPRCEGLCNPEISTTKRE